MTDNIHFSIKGAYQYDAIKSGICFQRSWHTLKYKKALELLTIENGDVVLDGACGSGVLTNLIARNNTVEVKGVDFSEAAIQFCNRQYTKTNLSFELLDLQEKRLEESSFDKIVMLETIEHLTPETASVILKNLFAYLRPGGRLVISTPNKNSLWVVIEFLLDFFKLTPKMKNEQHVKLYTAKSLKNVLEQSGFKLVSIDKSHFMAPWLSFLGLKTAENIHAAEQRLKFLPGSLLFASVQK